MPSVEFIAERGSHRIAKFFITSEAAQEICQYCTIHDQQSSGLTIELKLSFDGCTLATTTLTTEQAVMPEGALQIYSSDYNYHITMLEKTKKLPPVKYPQVVVDLTMWDNEQPCPFFAIIGKIVVALTAAVVSPNAITAFTLAAHAIIKLNDAVKFLQLCAQWVTLAPLPETLKYYLDNWSIVEARLTQE
jgi:hypothetical protein